MLYFLINVHNDINKTTNSYEDKLLQLNYKIGRTTLVKFTVKENIN